MGSIYSEEFKQALVQKALTRGNRTLGEICLEAGVSPPTLYLWVKKYAKAEGMNLAPRRPQDWSAQEKMKAVLEYEQLPELQKGEYLRSKGLLCEHLFQWKSLWEVALSSPASSEPAFSRAERNELQNKIKQLERDLHRKDKALSETAALLVLKKKADLIWGITEDESL